MAFSLQNPKKTLQLEFSLEKVQRAIINLQQTHDNLKLIDSHPALNLYVFNAIEDGGLNLGIFADISLKSVSENRTEIDIELRRKIGTFDDNYEYFKAGIHFRNIYNGISKIITLSDSDLQKLIKENEEKAVKKRALNKRLYGCILLPLCILFILLMTFAYIIYNK